MEIASLFASIGLQIDDQALTNLKDSLQNTQNTIADVFDEMKSLNVNDNTEEVKKNIENNIQQPLEEAQKTAEKGIDVKKSFGLSDIMLLANAISSILNLYKLYTNYKKKKDEKKNKGTQNSLSEINALKMDEKKAMKKAEEETDSFGQKILELVPIVLASVRVLQLLSKVVKGSVTPALLSCPLTWIVAGVMALVGALTLLFTVYKKFGSWENFKKGVDSSGKAVTGWAMKIRNAVAIVHNLFTGLIASIMILFEDFCSWFATNAKKAFDPLVQAFVKIKEFLKGIFAPVIEDFQKVFGWITEKLKGFTKYLPKWIKTKLGIDGEVSGFNDNMKNTAPEISNNNQAVSKQDNRQIQTTINVNGSKEPKEVAKEINNFQTELNSSSYILDGGN